MPRWYSCIAVASCTVPALSGVEKTIRLLITNTIWFLHMTGVPGPHCSFKDSSTTQLDLLRMGYLVRLLGQAQCF